MRNNLLLKKSGSLVDAFALLPHSGHVVAAMAAAEPALFFENLHFHANKHRNLHIHCANPTKSYTCFTDIRHAENLQFHVMFLTSAIRNTQGHNLVHYVPQHLSRWAQNLNRRHEIDVFWGTCSLPNDKGFVSLGINTCYESEILRKAKHVILEVNPNMPIVYGDTFVSIEDVTLFLHHDRPLPVLQPEAPNVQDRLIAKYISELVPDGATLQLGIGGIPNAVGECLTHKKNLGIHTELFTESMKTLYEHGVVDGSRKTLWPRKMVATFVYGSAELYKFVGENPALELYPASIINDPSRICRNFRMFSINSAVELDITGQVCSESVGHRELSGVGGATDTHTGAQRSEGGRGIIALRSMTPDQKTSKISFELKPGAKVSISRNDIDTVVTEYGVAQLIGLSVAERARALIAIAHPTVREELEFSARNASYI
ncbi:MAG: 4-hydroxybutyrate--acetyl-CoA CoA transferase [Betaproteobacteria bacterium]|nr:4-hydroxybutyrate--acetyl-CoA CoA transferase [Betaproteobacteria bacterium]